MKYTAYIREHFNDPKSPVVEFRELKTVLGLKKISQGYLKRLVSYLIKKGELKHISKGVYTFHDDIAVVGFAYRPFYYGLENALTIRKISEQGTNPVIITTKSVRPGIRKFENGNYMIKRINKHMFFGYDVVKYYDIWIPVSDCEKVLIDFVYFDQHINRDILTALKKTINRKKLNKYLESCKPKIRSRVNELLKNA